MDITGRLPIPSLRRQTTGKPLLERQTGNDLLIGVKHGTVIEPSLMVVSAGYPRTCKYPVALVETSHRPCLYVARQPYCLPPLPNTRSLAVPKGCVYSVGGLYKPPYVDALKRLETIQRSTQVIYKQKSPTTDELEISLGKQRVSCCLSIDQVVLTLPQLIGQNMKTPTQLTLVSPRHLLQAIENSVAHSKETAHGVTGLHFENYTITVRTRKDFCWYIECQLKPVDRRTLGPKRRVHRRLPCLKTNKETIVAAIVQNVGISASIAKRALASMLDAIKHRLADDGQVDLGKLGRMSVMKRTARNRISRNLKHVGPTIDRLYQKHPKTVRLTRRHDLTDTRQATTATTNIKEDSKPIVAVRRVQVAVAFPKWHRG